jgi:hypothetical protein
MDVALFFPQSRLRAYCFAIIVHGLLLRGIPRAKYQAHSRHAQMDHYINPVLVALAYYSGYQISCPVSACPFIDYDLSTKPHHSCWEALCGLTYYRGVVVVGESFTSNATLRWLSRALYS